MDKKKLLIVDDELMLLYSLRRMLSDKYDVTIALGGKKAIDTIVSEKLAFDLILCDVSMPDINGVNFCLYLEKHQPEQAKRIVFMTGGPTGVYLDDFFTIRSNLCLAKPFDAGQLMTIIEDQILKFNS